jgi:hypothetical protein
MKPVPYTVAADDLELLLLAIERYRMVTTLAEFEATRLFSTGVNFRLLRVRPDLDQELWQVYTEACLRLGLDPCPPES